MTHNMAEEDQTLTHHPPPDHKLADEDQKPPPHVGQYHHHLPPERGGHRRALCASLTVLFLLAGATALVLWLVYRPERPQFAVVGFSVYALNTTGPATPSLSAALQVTVVTRNPNRRVSVRFDHLEAFAAYAGQPVTPRAALEPFGLSHRQVAVMSPLLGGETVIPVVVPAEVAGGLAVEEAYGVVGLQVVVLGRLRWKAGAVKLRHYGFRVRCDVLLGYKRGFYGRTPLLRSPPCRVDL